MSYLFLLRSCLLAAVAASIFLSACPTLAQDNRLREVQHAMMLLGYYSGRADGLPNQKTSDALARFQKDNGLAASGRADDATLSALRGKRDALGGSLSLPPAGSAVNSQVPAKMSAAPQIPVDSRGGGAMGIQGTVAVPGRDRPALEQSPPPLRGAASPPTRIDRVERLSGSIAAQPSSLEPEQPEGFDWSMLMWGVVAATAGFCSWLIWLWSGIGRSWRRNQTYNPYLSSIETRQTIEKRRREPTL